MVTRESSKTEAKTYPVKSLVLLGIVVFVHGILSFLLFDPSITFMADDGNYIMGAKRFLEEGQYPLAHGATLYHLVLTIPFALFGATVLVGKYCSILWSTVTLILSFFAFRKIVPLWVLFGVLFIQASNFLIHFYGSSNMSESFYMMVQIIFIWIVLHHHDRLVSAIHKNKESILRFILTCIPIVLISFLVSISKSVGIVAPISIVFYLVVKKKWVNAAIFFSLFILIKSAYGFIIKSFYGIERLSSRVDYILLKSTYHPEEGNLDIPGLFNRLWENFNHHISSDFPRILGWRANVEFLEPNSAFSLLFLLMLLLALYWNWRRNSRMLFVGIHLSTYALVTFLSLQTFWKQDRMILVVIPLILLFLLDAAHHFLRSRAPDKIGIVYGFIAVLCIVNLNHLSEAIEEKRAIFREYLNGNKLYAYTVDKKNFLKAVLWSSENLPDDSVVLCRKANSAAVFASGDIQFSGRTTNTKKSGDQVLKELMEDNVTHILLAHLRIIPDQAIPGMVVGAIHSYVNAILEYRPEAIKVLYRTGNEEPALILAIDYASLEGGENAQSDTEFSEK